MKFGNLNIREGLKKRMGALALAGTMAVTMCGCSGNKNDERSRHYLLNMGMQYMTIEDTLDAVRDLTKMDEFLSQDKFVNASDCKEYTFDELLKLYEDAYDENDISECNLLLYKIGRMIMKAQIAEALYVEPGQITLESINVKSGYTSSVNITCNGRSQKIYLKGELANLAINILNACNHTLTNSLAVNAVYESYIEHLLTKTSVDKKIFREEYTISAYSSDEKEEAFISYDGARSSSPKYGYKYNGEDRGISLCDAIRKQKQEQSLNMQSKAIGSYKAKRLHH